MKIAIIGYGKMGHAIEALALARGHEIVYRTNGEWPLVGAVARWRNDVLPRPDVAVEFSVPTEAYSNVLDCMRGNVPVVCGTTGWYSRYDEAARYCREFGRKLLTATNFSVGMNIMFELNRRLAELMASHPEYSVGISETHHIHKLDAPSGTAITLQEQIVEQRCTCKGMTRKECDAMVPIASFREGEVPGTHTVRYDSPIDSIYLTHEAHSREGLAQGALLAAEWLVNAAPGVYTMRDVLV